MKKAVRFTALLMVCIMMASVCSCASKNAGDKRDQKERIISSEQFKAEGNVADDPASSSTFGALCQMTVSLLGKDIETAEKEIGGFFGVELIDRTGNILSGSRNGIESAMHVYTELLTKDDLRFNGFEIWTSKEDGHINRIEYGLANETYTGYDIGNTSDTQEEIRQLTAGVNEELKAAYGNPAETDKLVYDEDSFYNVYKVSDSCFINVEFRDFTEEGGNGLLSVDIIFADCEDLKYG